jgi:hypothetical protein
MNKPNAPQYAKDWHQCRTCGCTFPDRELRQLEVLDDVLKLKGEAYECLDPKRCELWASYRKAELQRDSGLSPHVPIRSRGGK